MKDFPSSILSALPKLQRCGNIILQKGDIFLHAPGFEDRTFAFSNTITGRAGAKCILFDYRPENGNNKINAVRSLVEQRGIVILDEDILIYNRFAPGDFSQRLGNKLKMLSAQRIILDISTMSKLAIILVMDVCLSLKLVLQIVYSEAATYGPSKAEFFSARDSDRIHRPSVHGFTGVHGVVRVESLSSVAMQGQPTAAIVFMSFNNALTQLLLNTVYPSRLFLINGRPPVHQWREIATAWVHDQVRREWAEDNPIRDARRGQPLPIRTVSTLDYQQSLALLIALYWQLSATHRILLAPSGSKMQTVACHLFKALHPDVHIEYPSPEGFAREYSTGVGTRWLIDFGLFQDRVTNLKAAEIQHYLSLT